MAAARFSIDDVPPPARDPQAAEAAAGWAVLRSAGITVAALSIVAFAVFAHTLHPAVALAATAAVALSASIAAPALAVATILCAALFQNLFVSLASPGIGSGMDFDLVRGYAFLILATVWASAFTRHVLTRRGVSPMLDRHLLVTSIAFAAIGFYLLVGMAVSVPSAIIYLRNVATGLMMYQAAVISARGGHLRLQTVFALVAGLVVVCGYTELLFRDDWLRFTNGATFWDLSMADAKAASYWDKQAQETGIVVLGLVDTFKITLFNTPLLADLGITLSRLFGPNMHAISYGYALSFLAIYALFTSRFLLATALLPLLVLSNAKGAIITVLTAVLGWGLARLFGSRFAFWCIFVLLVAYSAIGIVVGRRIGDFHVLGLIGGVYNFVEFPFGHGLGSGGNLGLDFATLDWSQFQAAGRTPIAMESAIGVLLYQMGFAAFVLLGVYVWLAWRTTLIAERTLDPLHLAAGFALLSIVFNGLFQEEALFSPLAVGLPLLLCGLIHGATFRNAAL
ncbi:hypothetical protein [Aureimonas sp. AU12]|uniref:hypothetical protein n=1 Tax=Aureimonas sp. AU12 TaxID=1638161 RepID=UPI000781DEC7|nr:hypothetical protein [Aureimonas sp. AU12]